MAAAAAMAAAVLYRYSPQEYSFYPRCPIFALTHHLCPGCGAMRALAALTHANIAAAWHFNAAITLLLPILLLYFGRAYWTAVREDRLAWPNMPVWTWQAGLTAVMLFGVARAIAPGTF
jgi:hypothetical protein